jgi:hypothetical protein
MAVDVAQVVTTASPVDNVLNLLTAFGFFRVVLPFLLIFSIVYGILLKTKVLGDPEGGSDKWVKSVSAIVSLAFAFLVIGYSPVVSALAILIPQASFLLVVALLVLMLLAMFGIKGEDYLGKPKWYSWLLILPVVAIMLAIIGAATGIPALAGFTNFLIGAGGPIDPELFNTLLGLGIVIGIPLVVIALVVWGSSKSGTT